MPMTRKDYMLIANAMRSSLANIINAYSPPADDAERLRDAHRRAVHAADCKTLALALAADNPRFDRDRFLNACGVN